MNELNNSPGCERASDLIAFIYNEASEQEARDFRLHLQSCSSCRAEVASFGVVRESITAWRDEALAGFVSTPVTSKVSRRSAIAALRQFFDLSPLWLKGATALAAITICVLAGMALLKRDNNHVSSTKPGAVYTEQDVNRIVNEALAKQRQKQASQEQAKQQVEAPRVDIVQFPKRKSKNAQAASSAEFATSRRPLSKAEREQLAADLRLLSGDEAALNLIGDRINQ
jgi:hypothetical protein